MHKLELVIHEDKLYDNLVEYAEMHNVSPVHILLACFMLMSDEHEKILSWLPAQLRDDELDYYREKIAIMLSGD